MKYSIKKSLSLLVIILLVTSCTGQLNVQKDADTHVYEIVEQSFTAQSVYANPYIDVDLWVSLSGPDGLNYRIPAFWDGGQTFRVRLVATKPGNWTWSTESKTGGLTGDSGLDHKTGSFNAIAWTEAEKLENPNRRGFIRVAENNHTLEYSDGTPFFYVADTWWSGLTKMFPFHGEDKDDADVDDADISFVDAVAERKKQGFNSLMFIASFPSERDFGIWKSLGHKLGEEKNLPDGLVSTAFEIDETLASNENVDIQKLAVDYTRIRPSYWHHVDRKFEHLWQQGFTPFVESIRRSEEWWRDTPEQRAAFTNYTRYLWARYGSYNLIYSWIHSEGTNNRHLYKYRPLVRAAYDELGSMPYGQPRTLMAWGSSLKTWAVDHSEFETPNNIDPPVSGINAPVDDSWTQALPLGAFDIHTIGNQHRNFNHHQQLRNIFSAQDQKPATNIEPYYPGWGNNKPHSSFTGSVDEKNKKMAQFQMYGNVLNGGFAGHAWGDNYFSGVYQLDISEGQGMTLRPDSVVYDRWGSSSMGKLRAFVLDEGHDYRTLIPATLTNQRETLEELRVLALNAGKTMGLGYVAHDNTETNLTNLLPRQAYSVEWYNIDTGVWRTVVEAIADEMGELHMPEKPNSNGWAYRIKAIDLPID